MEMFIGQNPDRKRFRACRSRIGQKVAMEIIAREKASCHASFQLLAYVPVNGRLSRGHLQVSNWSIL